MIHRIVKFALNQRFLVLMLSAAIGVAGTLAFQRMPVDAYPDLSLPAHFISASPVASSGMGTPIKTFIAVFGLDKSDPHLLPDLSAAVVLSVPGPTK